jgi:hypothetical protein
MITVKGSVYKLGHGYISVRYSFRIGTDWFISTLLILMDETKRLHKKINIIRAFKKSKLLYAHAPYSILFQNLEGLFMWESKFKVEEKILKDIFDIPVESDLSR